MLHINTFLPIIKRKDAKYIVTVLKKEHYVLNKAEEKRPFACNVGVLKSFLKLILQLCLKLDTSHLYNGR